ncbi:MAG: hypothetical protein V4787_22665 [Pseudomonadota bacterium]
MTAQHSLHFDTLAAGISAQLQAAMLQIPDEADALLEMARNGISPGAARGITASEYEALYAIARKFCAEGDFDSALPIALQLTLHNAMDARFSFIAGTCLQRKKLTVPAAGMFALALAVGGRNAAAMFRYGECLQAESERELAMEAFEAAIELADGSDDLHQLRRLAAAKLGRLREKAPA